MDKLGIHKVFISSFLKYLWNSPEVIHKILVKTEPEIVKTNLAPLIVNNFYCNLLSGNYMENNLLFIITMMLKDEIDKLENINQVDSFLENTKCSYLLEELQKFPDIQIYFKNVILKTVEIMERKYSFREIKFNVNEIINDLLKIKREEEKKVGKKTNNNQDLEQLYNSIITSKVMDLSINYSREENNQKNKQRNDLFFRNYAPDITINTFKERATNAKEENKNILYKYYKKLENDLQTDKDLYSNKVLLNNMLMANSPTHLLSFYQNDFLEVISYINQLLDDLKKNILLIPNSIKYICKIIYLLIKNKFENIDEFEINSFISKFIIDKLLIPIISNPTFKGLISEFIISGNTLKNIKKINYILQKLFSGKLFHNQKEEVDYTPFNWLIMDKMENVLYFFEKAINVNLPNFIEKYINDELPKDYCYDYFNENKEQFYADISICFNVNNICYLIEGIRKDDTIFQSSNPKIEKLQKIVKKLKPDKIIKINEMKNNENTEEEEKIKHRHSFGSYGSLDTKKLEKEKKKEKEKEKEKKKEKEKEKKKDKEKDKEKNKEKIIENYFIFNDNEIDEKYKYLFSINNNIANFYINIKEKEKIKKLDKKEKNIIKIKNYLCNSLGNYRLLNKSDFDIESISNTIKMLNEIKNYMSLPYFILNNNNVPSIWYINSLLDYLEKIPEDYKENDYKKLFNELEENLKESINSLDFELLIIFRNKLKFIDKINNYYEEVRQLINNATINDNIKYIVEEVFIPVDVNFIYDEDEQIFELMKSNIKEKAFEDKLRYEDPKKRFNSFRTIEAFTRYFPNLIRYQFNQDINPLDIVKELSINNKINDYFEIVKEKIIKKPYIELTKYETLYEEKIKNYIMNKIYDKIYPPEPSQKDVKIFKKTTSLSWVEPNQILEKEYIFDNMLPGILNEFKQINKAKTPYKKLNCLNNIFRSVINLIKFNEGVDKEIGADDITPVLNYIAIKAHPFRIFTDFDFIRLFSESNGDNENSLVSIENIFLLILDFSAKNLNVSPEEYNRKCIEATRQKQKDDFTYNPDN